MVHALDILIAGYVNDEASPDKTLYIILNFPHVSFLKELAATSVGAATLLSPSVKYHIDP